MTRQLMVLATLIAAIITTTEVARSGENQLTPREKAEGWQLLFNGKDHTGWKCNNGKPIASPIEDGCLTPYKSGGYLIIYDKPFSDFILKCDVKWEKDPCNSGVFFRVEDPNNPVHTGFEMQVASGKGTGKHDLGAIYDLVPVKVNAGKPAGQWNHVEITCRGPIIKVKLNGKEVARMNCDDFDKPGFCPDGQHHKFKLHGKPRAIKDFARKGYIGFQDHGHKVWFRNVKILELK